jgi:predicted phosphodiesterase
MKICLFGDIHGNLPAFQAAMPKIKGEGADLNICLGDICGYYFDEAEIIDSLRKLPSLVVLRGNHDDLFLRVGRGEERLKEDYAKSYGPSLDLFLAKNRGDILEWIESCPLTYRNDQAGLAAFHGSPKKPLEEYVYPDSSLAACTQEGLPWIFLGHTHYAMDRSEAGTRIVNPGSLGQPRDGGHCRYAVVDTERSTVQFINVQFDRRSFVDSVRLRAPDHKYLGDVFDRISDDS